jgi:hypothetical protein
MSISWGEAAAPDMVRGSPKPEVAGLFDYLVGEGKHGCQFASNSAMLDGAECGDLSPPFGVACFEE